MNKTDNGYYLELTRREYTCLPRGASQVHTYVQPRAIVISKLTCLGS